VLVLTRNADGLRRLRCGITRPGGVDR
jgi:hypothetical protein